ncbi:hypothetical protein L0222_09610 [bacterium]|nr:hypothetical protein [bacterium]MCI0602518.1 hypothetical protein [bacterium]
MSPLRVWKVVFAVASVFVILLLFLDPGVFDARRRAKLRVRKLQQLELKNDEFSILVTGNSMLMAALPKSEKHTAELLTLQYAGNGKRPVRVIYAWVLSGRVESLAILHDEIIRLRPDMVVIQFEMLIKRKIPRSHIRRLQIWSELIHQILSDSIHSELRIRRSSNSQIQNKFPLDVKRNQRAGRGARGVKNPALEEILLTDSDLMIGRRFIESALSAGIHVVAVDAPLNPLRAAATSQDYLKAKDKAVRFVYEQYDPVYFRFREGLPADCFNDYFHVNEKGRTIFSEWFLAAVVRELPGTTSIRSAK